MLDIPYLSLPTGWAKLAFDPILLSQSWAGRRCNFHELPADPLPVVPEGKTGIVFTTVRGLHQTFVWLLIVYCHSVFVVFVFAERKKTQNKPKRERCWQHSNALLFDL